MPTGSTFPVRLCFRSLTNVSVVALTVVTDPFSQMAVSMQWASRSPVTPDPAAATSSRQRAVPPRGRAGLVVPSRGEVGRVGEDPAELPGVDDLLGERHGRPPPVVVPDGVRHARPLDGRHHLL